MKPILCLFLALVAVTFPIIPRQPMAQGQAKRQKPSMTPVSRRKGDPPVSIPVIARILGIQVGWNGRECLENRFGEGTYSIGGHSNGVESWQTHRPHGHITTEGFCYNREGEVLESVTWEGVPGPAGTPFAKHLPQHPGWLGKIEPGMIESQVTHLLADSHLPIPTKSPGVWTWTQQGFVRPNPQNEDVYRTWTATLRFARGHVTAIEVQCQ